ncbi:putative transposase [Shigella flexneri VA-6]|nr:putative transposase [Shigella flexneri VA-6]
MSRKTQRYSKEFKAEAVRTVLENQLSISEGASRLSLPEGTLGLRCTGNSGHYHLFFF